MHRIRIKALTLAAFFGLTALFMMLHWLGQVPAVLAREEAITEPVDASSRTQAHMRPDLNIDWYLPTTDTNFYDLSGTGLGKGVYQGKLKCVGENCSQKTTAELLGTTYEYKFSTRQFADPVDQRVVVAGIGIMTRDRQKERFSFVATFENNSDGTVSTVSSVYDASIPEASFIIPKAEGKIVFKQK